MKNILFTLLFIFFVKIGVAQTLYDYEWTYLGTKYTGLVVFFNENDIHIRMGFDKDGGYHVIQSNYAYSADENEGSVYLEEIESRFIQDEGAREVDVFHFIWITDDQGQMVGPYVISDYDLENDLMDQITLVDVIEVKPSDLTDEYLGQYYFPDESEYQLLKNSTIQQEYVPVAGQEKVNLHLIIVANTAISDIGTSTRVDMDNLAGELQGISEVLKMEYKETRISDKEFTKARLVAALNQLQPQPDDVVIFYYSGHGFRYSDASEKFPQLDMRYNPYQEFNSESNINLNEVNQIIKGKGARLNIVLGDCCNNDVGITKQVSTSFMASRANVNANIEKLKKLFLTSKGNMIAAGASAGEYSWCSSQGGFFTNSLISAIREETSSLKPEDTPSWDDIIIHVKESTRKKSDLCNNCQPQNVVFEESIP